MKVRANVKAGPTINDPQYKIETLQDQLTGLTV